MRHHALRGGIVAIASIFALGGSAQAQDVENAARGFGIGIVLGEPTGLSLIGRDADLEHAWQSHISWSLVQRRARVSLDYLNTVGTPNVATTFNLPVTVGLGGIVALGELDDNDPIFLLGARLPVGAAIVLDDLPLDIFIEGAPELFVIPELMWGWEGAIGGRIYL